MRRRHFLISLLVLTIVNGIIFLFRERFQYRNYASHATLYSTCNVACEEKWNAYVHDFPQNELNEAKQISNSVIGNAKTDYEKIIRIGAFLYANFHQQLGSPSTRLMASSPMDQYRQLLAADSTELWCNNFSQIFTYFCWSQGIVSRNIQIMKSGDNHVVSESYCREKQRWVLTDLTNNLIAVEKNSSPLHLIDLIRLTGRQDSMKGWRFIQDRVLLQAISLQTPTLTAYYSQGNPLVYYHWVNYFKTLHGAFKLKEYILPVSWYEIYDDKDGSNVLFWVKSILFMVWIAAILVFLIFKAKFKA